MSRWPSLGLRPALLVSLEPHALAWWRPGEGRQRVQARAGAGAPWEGAVRALRERATQWRRERAAVRVVLSNRFVRYALLPASEARLGAEEEQALARHCFSRIHGEASRYWTVRVAPGSRLAAAVDTPLIEALADCFPRGGPAHLAATEPLLASAFNRWRERVPREGACLVLPEPRRICVAALDAAGWLAVYNAAEEAPSPEQWKALLAREAERAGRPLPSLVLVRPAAQPDLLPLDDVPATHAWSPHGAAA